MLVHYKGGRSWLKVTLNRKSIYFSKENDFTVDVKNQEVINHIFGLSNHDEFEAVENQKEKPEQPEKQEENIPDLSHTVIQHKKPGRKPKDK